MVQITKVAIVGSRDFEDYEYLKQEVDYVLSRLDGPFVLVSGGARGADRLGEKYSSEHNWLEPIIHLPDWYPKGVYDRGAGFKRNSLIVDELVPGKDILIAFQIAKSSGTQDTLNKALARGIEIHLREI